MTLSAARKNEREVLLIGEVAADFIDSINEALNSNQALMDTFCTAIHLPEVKEIIELAADLRVLQEFRDAVQRRRGGSQAAFEINPEMAWKTLRQAEVYATVCDRIMTPFALASHMPERARSSIASSGYDFAFTMAGADKLAEICALRI